MTDPRQNALDYAHQNNGRFVDELIEFLAIPSISTSSENNADVQRGAEWVAAQLRSLGMDNVQILPTGETPDTAHAVDTNRVDMSATYDPRTKNFIITSAEDNLKKGASGQAIQIMNLWCGFPETAGLL